MGKAEVITVEQARKAGGALKQVASSLQGLSEREAVEGALVVSLERVALLQQMDAVLSQPAVEAMILQAGRQLGTYEIAESRDRPLPEGILLHAVRSALCKGYLLADAAGPHFTIIAGKGASATAMIKEAGHRYRLSQSGCTDIRVTVSTLGVRQRPNAAGKHDMLVWGRATCTHNGKAVVVERPQDMPYALPCYESDGPDGHEAKARRRLLRDLWAAVSGEWAIDSEDEIVQPVVATDTPLPRIADSEIDPQALYDGTMADLKPYLLGLPEDGTRQTFAGVLELIDETGDPELLQGKIDSDIVPTLRQLKVSRSIGEKVVRLANQRIAVLRAQGR